MKKKGHYVRRALLSLMDSRLKWARNGLGQQEGIG